MSCPKEKFEKRIKEIENREVVEKIEEHEPVEIPCEKNKITIGPPTLTRFEKARIMGARALQLSLGAPPFIPIPKNARISLDISMEELEQRVIPITIRRVLPNGDYQNAYDPTRFVSKVTMDNSSFDVFLNALNEEGESKILSNPKISVMNGQPALITVGRNVTYIDNIESDLDSDSAGRECAADHAADGGDQRYLPGGQCRGRR